MMKLFLLVPMLLLSVTQLIALLGMPGEAQAHGLRRRQLITAEAAYLVGFLGATSSLVQGILLRNVGESASRVALDDLEASLNEKEQSIQQARDLLNAWRNELEQYRESTSLHYETAAK